MSLKRRILASRANGALSKGPSTVAGKERSAQNAIRHGLLADCVLLQSEHRETFQSLLDLHIQRLQPADEVEFGFIEEMVASHWRLQRAWTMETRILDNRVATQPPGDPVDRMAAAFSSLAGEPALGLMHRYQSRIHNTYQRALNNFLLLRTVSTQEAELPNETSMTAEPATPGDENVRQR